MVALGGMDQHSEERTEELAGMDRHTWRNGQTHLDDFIGTLGGMDGCTDSNGQTHLEECAGTLLLAVHRGGPSTFQSRQGKTHTGEFFFLVSNLIQLALE